MKMQVGKWGNSLAVRLPREIVEKYGVKEGDVIDTRGIETVMADEHAEAREARRQKALDEIGQGWLTLPSDWKFDREQANWRPASDRW